MSSSRDQGFTLVEILVALTIFAISAAVLLDIISINLDRTSRVRDETVATSLLQSLLAQAETATPLRGGVSDGAFAKGFRWQLRVEPYGSEADRQAWPVGAETIAATVFWKENGKPQSRSLTTLRVTPGQSQ